MNPAKSEHIKEEKLLIGNIWNVLKSIVDENPNRYLGWDVVVSATVRLETVIATCKNPMLKTFAEKMSLSCIRYLNTEQMGNNHEEEVKVVNEIFRLLKFGYWIKYDGDEAAEDWEELVNIAKAVPSGVQDNMATFASSMVTALLGYLSDISENRFNKAMEKAEKANGANVS